MIKQHVRRFGIINTVEGYSYLALLFISLVLLMIPAYFQAQWKFKCNLLFFIASLVPFGTFYTRAKIKAYE